MGLWQVNILSEKNVKLQHKETWGFSLPVVLQKRTLSTFILLGWKQPWAAPLLILNHFSYIGINSGGSHQKHSGLAEHLTSLPLSKDECPLQRAHNMSVSHTWLWRYNTTLNYDHFSSQKIVNEKKSTGRDTWKKKITCPNALKNIFLLKTTHEKTNSCFHIRIICWFLSWLLKLNRKGKCEISSSQFSRAQSHFLR